MTLPVAAIGLSGSVAYAAQTVPVAAEPTTRR
jgi:hypothetical protein